MANTNVLNFPAERRVASQGNGAKRRRSDKSAFRALSDPLLARAAAAPEKFHKLFLLRLEIIVNEFEIDVEKYA